MLADKTTYTTLPTTDLERARRFYRDTLGLREAMVTEGGVMYSSGGSQFFVYPSRYRPGGHTQMSWVVDDIRAEVSALREKGVEFDPNEIPTRPTTVSPTSRRTCGRPGSGTLTGT